MKKNKKPLTEWDKMTKQQRMEAYTALLKENRDLKRALRDYQEREASQEEAARLLAQSGCGRTW